MAGRVMTMKLRGIDIGLVRWVIRNGEPVLQQAQYCGASDQVEWVDVPDVDSPSEDASDR
jgi:hypothetical protein